MRVPRPTGAYPANFVTATSQLAFVFPGQGSQSVGMLAELSESNPVVRDTFEEASEGAGVDLWALSQAGPAEMLDRTEYTQPALLAAGVVYSGTFNIAADDPHWGVTSRTIEAIRDRSISRQASELIVPDKLDDPSLIASGASEYAEMCTGCHLAPDMSDT